MVILVHPKLQLITFANINYEGISISIYEFDGIGLKLFIKIDKSHI